MAIFVYSPSNMSTYATCPRKFQAQTVTKEISWKASAQKSRGTLVHNSVEKALQYGEQAVTSWPSGIDVFYLGQRIQETRQAVAGGATLLIEHELVIDQNMRPAPDGWWDDTALLRAKADAVILPPLPSGPAHGLYHPAPHAPAKLVDIKTGKKWDDDDFQLRAESLLVHLIYQHPVVDYEYWYVDQGETVDGRIDFRNGLAPVQDIIDLMRDMKFAMRNNYFPIKKNKFCKWCGLYQTPGCK